MEHDFQLRAQVIPLRQMGYSVMRICDQLGLHKAGDFRAVQAICDEKELRRYQKGFSISGPVKAGPNRSQQKVA
jgi:hypothetical protein